MKNQRTLLMIVPKKNDKGKPIDDGLTKMVKFIIKFSKVDGHYKGSHECICGLKSGSAKYVLPNGMETNNLIVHYAREHRKDLRLYPKEIEKIINVYFELRKTIDVE